MVLKRGSRGDDVKKLQRGLALLGYRPGPADGIFGGGTEEAVTEFQTKSKILADGIVGRGTLKVFNAALDAAQDKLPDYASCKIPPAPPSPIHPVAPDTLMKWVKCPADKFEDRGGYTRLSLREDAAEAYKALYEEVHSLGGIITTAGGKRRLSSKTSPSRSKKSMHYVGLAFDMALPTAMQNPDKDPYLIQRDGESRKWIVWCKTDNPDVPRVTVEACWVTGHKDSRGRRYTQLNSKPVTCRAFNFTELANKHGFERISGRRSFFKGGTYTGSEWWHFQFEKALTRGQSMFGEELLKIYPEAEAKAFAYWDESYDCVFGKTWF